MLTICLNLVGTSIAEKQLMPASGITYN